MYKPNVERLNKKLKSIGSGKYFKLQEGDNKIRVLPPVQKDEEFYTELTQHHGFSDGQYQRAHPCLEAMKNKPCPACVLYRKAIEEGDKDVSQKIRPVTSYISNIVDRADNTIKLWSYNAKMLKAIINYLLDEDYGPEVLDPDSGRDFTITREGTGIQTRYGDPRVSPKSKPLGIDDWEDKIHDAKAEFEYLSYDDFVDQLESNYGDYIEEWGVSFKTTKEKSNGVGKKVQKESDEGDTEEPVRAKPSAKPVTKTAKPVRDEEDSESVSEDSLEDDEEILIEDDEEEVAPKKKVK